jgi:prophage regulatory protein
MKKQKWNDVRDSLPEDGGTLLVSTEDGCDMDLIRRSTRSEWYDFFNSIEGVGFTHWRKLPKPPVDINKAVDECLASAEKGQAAICKLGEMCRDELDGASTRRLPQEEETVDRILRRREVTQITGLSRSGLYDLIAKNQFPRPVKLGLRAVGWRRSEIVSWIDSRSTSVSEPKYR